MSYWRMFFVASDTDLKTVESVLQSDFQSKRITQKNGAVLIAAEGRAIPDLPANVSTLGVDGRNTTYYVSGDTDLADAFNAKIELTVGFEISLSDLPRVKANKVFKKATKVLKEIDDNFWEDEDEDRYGIRLDLTLDDEASEAMESLKAIHKLFSELGISHRVAFFDGVHGTLEGDLEEANEFIGPSAYARASWDVQVMRTETVELVINDAEALLDGSSVEYDD